VLDPPCGFAGSAPVLQFDVDKDAGDAFYGTQLTITPAGWLVLDGRSTAMDSFWAGAGTPRMAAPGNCNFGAFNPDYPYP
jgi:hypothetical protein